MGGQCRPKKASRALERPGHDSKGGGKCQLQEGHDPTEVLKRSFWLPLRLAFGEERTKQED